MLLIIIVIYVIVSYRKLLHFAVIDILHNFFLKIK